MNAIPPQLQRQEYRFILCRKQDKRPIEKDWPNQHYRHDDAKLQQWLTDGNNYGIVTGIGNLVVIDFDDETYQENKITQLPETFSVTSGSGRKHLYYKTDTAKGMKIKDENGETLADIQGIKKFVIAPGSTHPNGQQYRVCDDTEINYITWNEIEANFSEKKMSEIKPKSEKNRNETSESIKKQLKVSEVLTKLGVEIKGGESNTNCPMHPSKNGKCLHYDDQLGLWNCFHCDKGGSIIDLTMHSQKLKFPRAIKWLSENFQLNLPQNEGRVSETIRTEILELLADENKNEATEKIASYFLSANDICTTRKDEHSEMWIYNEGIYKPEGRTYLQEYCRQILGNAYRTHIYADVEAKVQADTYIEQDEFFREESPDFICLQNGILNLQTKTLAEFTPNMRFFNKLPVTYDAPANCPAIKEFFANTLKEKDVSIIQEFFGFILYRDYFINRSFMLVGKGRNGKGVTMRLVHAFVGQENTTDLPLETIEKEPFEVGNIHKKLVNISGDINRTALDKTAKWKKLTGRDMITAQRKFLSSVSFINYGKMIFACNELPPTTDNNLGFYERWIIVDFPYTFLPQTEIDAMPAEKLRNVKVQDIDILGKITAPQEMSGLLNWAIEGLERLWKYKNFSFTPPSYENEAKWTRLSDSLATFVKDCCSLSWGVAISKDKLRMAYTDYCRKNELRMLADRELKPALEEKFGIYDNRKMEHFTDEWGISDSRQVWYWNGICLKTPDEPSEIKPEAAVNPVSESAGNTPEKTPLVEEYVSDSV